MISIVRDTSDVNSNDSAVGEEGGDGGDGGVAVVDMERNARFRKVGLELKVNPELVVRENPTKINLKRIDIMLYMLKEIFQRGTKSGGVQICW